MIINVNKTAWEGVLTFILFVIIIFVAMSCTGKYEDIKFKISDGLVSQIDSSKYEPVLLYDKGDRILIASKEGIKEVKIYDVTDCVVAGILLGFLACVFGLFLARE